MSLLLQIAFPYPFPFRIAIYFHNLLQCRNIFKQFQGYQQTNYFANCDECIITVKEEQTQYFIQTKSDQILTSFTELSKALNKTKRQKYSQFWKKQSGKITFFIDDQNRSTNMDNLEIIQFK
ncbi:unnamed protein product (macronuclear) [Paramecium tetraurelia]|uniref:Uncharacterized protein n=1 Tax=Paramecium tetraurelia TaxID=5888 RepID=A0BFL1_PARTE|nr:uncharacterized protein GSPATT00028363001 [Paramecium tetraurelia]CAK57328.1 unnamed protein product [Paramecium tetraurelia]|eukprot:XP_001424726.1 hypothetical protein (macronuclear) [Paramecium tetraurelia strain d4-2]